MGFCAPLPLNLIIKLNLIIYAIILFLPLFYIYICRKKYSFYPLLDGKRPVKKLGENGEQEKKKKSKSGQNNPSQMLRNDSKESILFSYLCS